MSQDRMENKDVGQKPMADTGFQAPEIDTAINRASNAMRKVHVIHGANEGYFDNLEGKTVGYVRKSLREVYSIPGDAESLIDGKAVNDDFVLAGGQTVEFLKEAGVKG